MKINKSRLLKIVFKRSFVDYYKLKDDEEIILNNMSVYAVKNDIIQYKVGFFVSAGDENGKGRIITPVCRQNDCDSFLLMAYRVAMCKTIEIKSTDYIDMINSDGNFVFTFENNKEGKISD